MKLVIQRVKKASVSVNDKEIGSIQQGYVILVGIHEEDKKEDIAYAAKKVANLRLFSDQDDKINLSIQDIKGSILSISQFTLLASTRKGNRPSFSSAANQEKGKQLYELFNQLLREQEIPVEKGCFGANMQVSLINDGPVTIVLDTREK